MTRTVEAVIGRLLLALVLVMASWVGGGQPAHAVDQSKGLPGKCPTAVGVTVVVDFQDLGGQTIVRCFPKAVPGTGLDALKGAGFQIAGVQRWGDAFICRIENRPSAVESLSLYDHQNYREACIDTPPASAYWSYWWAGNNCQWAYSQWGVKNRQAVPGGFEGWSFSMNKTADTNPMPRVAPVRPGTEGGSCGTADEPAPTSTNVDEKLAPNARSSQEAGPRTAEPATGGTQGGDSGQTQTNVAGQAPAGNAEAVGPTAAPGGAAKQPAARQNGKVSNAGEAASAPSAGVAAGPSAGVAAGPAAASGRSPAGVPQPLPRGSASASVVPYTGGENAPDVNQVIKAQAGASDYAPWVAGGIIVALTVGAFALSRHRRRMLER